MWCRSSRGACSLVAIVALAVCTFQASPARADEPSEVPNDVQAEGAATPPTLRVASEPDPSPGPALAVDPSRPERPSQIVAPPPPLPPGPVRSERWYGWQILIAHGLSDSLAVAGALVSYENSDAGLALAASSWIARGGSSALIEAVHDGHWQVYGVSNLLGSALGAAIVGRNTVDALHAPSDPSTGAFVRGLAVGGIVTAGIVTAIEASLAFEPDPDGGFVVVPSANGLAVRGAF